MQFRLSDPADVLRLPALEFGHDHPKVFNRPQTTQIVDPSTVFPVLDHLCHCGDLKAKGCAINTERRKPHAELQEFNDAVHTLHTIFVRRSSATPARSRSGRTSLRAVQRPLRVEFSTVRAVCETGGGARGLALHCGSAVPGVPPSRRTSGSYQRLALRS